MTRHPFPCRECYGTSRLPHVHRGISGYDTCDSCEDGKVYVDDDLGLIPEGGIVTAVNTDWIRLSDGPAKEAAYRRQWEARAIGLVGYGESEVAAARDLFRLAEKQESEPTPAIVKQRAWAFIKAPWRMDLLSANHKNLSRLSCDKACKAADDNPLLATSARAVKVWARWHRLKAFTRPTLIAAE